VGPSMKICVEHVIAWVRGYGMSKGLWGSSEGRRGGIDMMVYSRIKGLEGGQSNAGNRVGSRLPNGERSAEDAEDRERVNGEGNGGDRPMKVEKTKVKNTSFEAVLDGDPTRFVIGLRMMLEFLQGRE
jgi:hypothetical protein